MIKTQKLVPEVFYNRSRDFQLLGRIYDIVFNYLKTNLDTIENSPCSDNLDNTLVDLVTTTLGFKGSHNYNVNQLKALCSIFSIVIRNKGNIQSIKLVLQMLANIDNVSKDIEVVEDEDDPYCLLIFVPEDIKDITLFQDVLDYILPAGITCKMIQQSAVSTYSQTVLNVGVTYDKRKKKSSETSRVTKAKLNDQLVELLATIGRVGVVQDSTVVGAVGDGKIKEE